jgi:hypothetical protein
MEGDEIAAPILVFCRRIANFRQLIFHLVDAWNVFRDDDGGPPVVVAVDGSPQDDHSLVNTYVQCTRSPGNVRQGRHAALRI